MDSPSITQKEAFLFYLQRMDMDMLDIILPDNISFFGVAKTVFIERLSYILNQHKLAGETGLLTINHKVKTSNAYYLTSKILDIEQEFIIEEKKGNITNITSSLTMNSSYEELEQLHCLELFFGIDERLDFMPTNDYLIRLQRCTNAFEEIINDKITILDKISISYWVKKHKSLYKEIKNEAFMFKYNDFRNLYFALKCFMETLQCYKKAKKAINTYDNSNGIAIQKWLDENNRLFFCESQSFAQTFNNIDEINKTVKLNIYPSILFKGKDFISIIKFNKLYLKHCEFNPIAIEDSNNLFNSCL